MRGLSVLYTHECVVNGCEASSEIVQLLLALDNGDLQDPAASSEAGERTNSTELAVPPSTAAAALPTLRALVPVLCGAEPVALNLSNRYFGDRGLNALFHVLMTMPRLRSVSLCAVGMTELGVAGLCTIITQHRSLEEVDIRGNALFATSGRLLTEALRKASARVHVFLVDTDDMPARIARRLREQVGRNVALKFPLDLVVASRRRGWGDRIEDHDSSPEANPSCSRAADVSALLVRRAGATEQELRILGLPQVSDAAVTGLEESVARALRCYNRCGAFAAQLACDFGLDGAAMEALDELSTCHSLENFRSHVAATTEAAAAPPPIDWTGCGRDPLDVVVQRARRITMSCGYPDPLEDEAAASSPATPLATSLRAMIVQAADRPLLEHKVDDLHRRLKALVRRASCPPTASDVEEGTELPAEQRVVELVDLLTNVEEAFALTTVMDVPLLDEAVEASVYADQRYVVSELYEKKRSLLLLADQCRYFVKTPLGQRCVARAQQRYDACRGAIRVGDLAAFSEEVLEALRHPGALQRRELLMSLQQQLPPALIRSWVQVRLRRAVATWVGHRYVTPEFNDLPCVLVPSPLPARTTAVAAALARGLFFDVRAFPHDFVLGLAGVACSNDLVLLCRQHAAVVRQQFIDEHQ